MLGNCEFANIFQQFLIHITSYGKWAVRKNLKTKEKGESNKE